MQFFRHERKLHVPAAMYVCVSITEHQNTSYRPWNEQRKIEKKRHLLGIWRDFCCFYESTFTNPWRFMQFFSIQILKLLECILTKSRKPCFALQETMSKAFTSLFLKRFTHKDPLTNYHQHATNIAGPTEHATCQPVVHIYKRTASPNASASAFLTKLPFQNAALRLQQATEQRVGALRMKFWFIYIF